MEVKIIVNSIQVKEKLTILLTSSVITQKAFHVTLNTFDYLSKKFKKEVIDNSEMFWTHMSMALTRMERGECEDGPSNTIMNEVNETPYKEDIEEIINHINSLVGQELPEGERVYFYLHLHRVIESNK